MTPQQIEQHRQRFEALKIADLDDPAYLVRNYDGYQNTVIDIAWEGYLLCAENMPEIELPSHVHATENYDTKTEQLAYMFGVSGCKDSIESQGCTVKTL